MTRPFRGVYIDAGAVRKDDVDLFGVLYVDEDYVGSICMFDWTVRFLWINGVSCESISDFYIEFSY